MNAEIEDLKQKFSNNSSLTTIELELLLESFIDTILIKGRFDNTIKAFYNYGNFSKLTKLVALEDSSRFSHLFKKIDYVRVIETKLFNKEAKMQIFAGIILFLFGVGSVISYWSIADFEIIALLIVVFILSGVILFLRGISNYR